jgi:phytoene synthase
MTDASLEILPPTRLAIAYVPAHLRSALTLLLQMDMRFGDIVGTAGEPMIAQIKMAWWRETLTEAVDLRPKGEPLLQALAAVGGAIPLSALEALVSAWEELLGSDEWNQAVTDTHTQLRAEAIFQTYANWVGSAQDVRPIGRLWAIETLRKAFPQRIASSISTPLAALPKGRALRPLSILHMSVRTASGPRLVWHALTGL